MKYSIDYKNTLIELERNVKHDMFKLLVYLENKIESDIIDYNKTFEEVTYNCPKDFDFDIMINGASYKPSKIILSDYKTNEYISVKILSNGLEYNVTEIYQIVDLYDYLYHLYINYIVDYKINN